MSNRYASRYEEAMCSVGDVLSFALSDESVTDCVKPKDVQRVSDSLKDVAAVATCLRGDQITTAAAQGVCCLVAVISCGDFANRPWLLCQ